ncbi:MAG: hypothetical protein ACRC17_03205 [Culicoidibacterales bacterium]
MDQANYRILPVWNLNLNETVTLIDTVEYRILPVWNLNNYIIIVFFIAYTIESYQYGI